MKTQTGLYALVKDDTVVNVLVAEHALIARLILNAQIDEGVLIKENQPHPNIGERYADGLFTSTAPTVQVQD
jgi:hypothetical protein